MRNFNSNKTIKREKKRLEMKRLFEVRKDVYEKWEARCEGICEYGDCKDCVWEWDAFHDEIHLTINTISNDAYKN